MRLITSLAVAFTFVGLAAGQPVNPVSVPAIEDINLYQSFFNYHQGLINALQASISTSPSSSSVLNQQMATLLGVAVNELPTVIANTQQVTQSYAQIAVKRQSAAAAPPVAPKPGQPTLAQTNAELNMMQVRATVDGAHALFLKLSTSSWNGIHSYIVGTYRNTIYKP